MERIRKLTDALGTALLVACALVVTGLVVRRELGGRASPAPGIERIAGWEDLARDGNRIGPPDADFQIIEFSDFQCPFCRRAATILDSVRQRFGDRLAIIYRHYPIEAIHPHAVDAALAAECAADQGMFPQFHDALFKYQDSIGVAPWTRIAALAGVPDSVRLSTCILEGGHRGRVTKDLATADRIGIQATPTFIFNGRVLRGALSVAEWEMLLKADR